MIPQIGSGATTKIIMLYSNRLLPVYVINYIYNIILYSIMIIRIG